MQAIQTKFIGPTNYRDSRIKASCERGSLTVSWDHGLDSENNHIRAAQLLVDKFIREDEAQKRYSTQAEKNPWGRPRICGSTKEVYIHTFLPHQSVLIQADTMADCETISRAIARAQDSYTGGPQLAGPLLSMMIAALARSTKGGAK